LLAESTLAPWDGADGVRHRVERVHGSGRYPGALGPVREVASSKICSHNAPTLCFYRNHAWHFENDNARFAGLF
jgi:hypothetical protein